MTPTIHPGKVLLGEVLARDWSLTETARRMKIDVETVRDLLLELEDVTVELAEKLAVGTGIEADYWLRIQTRYDTGENIIAEQNGPVSSADQELASKVPA